MTILSSNENRILSLSKLLKRGLPPIVSPRGGQEDLAKYYGTITVTFLRFRQVIIGQ